MAEQEEQLDETMLNDGEVADDSVGVEEAAEAGVKAVSRSTLAIVLLVLLAGVGIFVMYKRNGPSAASAAPAATANDATVSQFLQGGGTNVKVMEQMLRKTEEVVNQFRKYPSMAQIPLSELQTNPFRHQHAKSASTPGGGESAEARRQREAERQAVLKAVQGLQLGSIMHSDAQRACMVNNAMYTEGQQVEGFTVEKITPMSVIVRKGAYRFELKMQK